MPSVLSPESNSWPNMRRMRSCAGDGLRDRIHPQPVATPRISLWAAGRVEQPLGYM